MRKVRDSELEEYHRTGDWVDSLHKNTQPGAIHEIVNHSRKVTSTKTDYIDLFEDREKVKIQYKNALKSVRKKQKRIIIKTNRSLKQSSRLGVQTFKAYPKFSTFIVAIFLVTVLMINFGRSIARFGTSTLSTSKTPVAPAVKGASRTIIYPTQLPNGFSILKTPNSTINNDNVSAYIITNGNINITVSQLDNIPTDAFEKLFKGNGEIVNTKIGTGLVLKEGGDSRLAGVRLADGRTILMSTKHPIDKSILTLMLLRLDSE